MENTDIIEALKPKIEMIPLHELKNLQRLSELTGHNLDACIAGWWIRFGEVQTLQIELESSRAEVARLSRMLDLANKILKFGSQYT